LRRSSSKPNIATFAPVPRTTSTYSWRSAASGSTDAARRAGTTAAASETSTRTSAALISASRSAARASTWKRISLSMSRSIRERMSQARTNDLSAARGFIARSSEVAGGGAQEELDRAREALPVVRLFAQPLSAGGGERVVLRLALVVGLAPLEGDQALVLEAVQRGVERPLRNLQRVFRDLLQAQQHAVTVPRAERDGLEGEKGARALAELR